MLGAWVATITLEQAVFVKREGGWWQLWLAVVSVSLGGVGIWCAMIMASTALSLSKTHGGASLPLDFSFSAAFLGILPSLVLTWSGLMVSVGDFESQPDSSKATVEIRQLRRLRQKRAAVSFMAQLDLLKHSWSWRVLLGSSLIASAVLLTRLPLMSIWVAAATSSTPSWSWAVTIVLDAVMVAFALLLIMHAVRWKVLGVLLFAGAVMQDWLIGTSSIRWYLASSVSSTPSALSKIEVSATTVQLVAGIIASGICLIFIGLQFSRMKLSRNGLSALAASLEQVIETLKETVAERDSRLMQQLRQLNTVSRMLDCVSLLSPHPTEYAYALASATTYPTFQADWTAPIVIGDIPSPPEVGQTRFDVHKLQRMDVSHSGSRVQEPHVLIRSPASQGGGDGSRTVAVPSFVSFKRSPKSSSIELFASRWSQVTAKPPVTLPGSCESVETEALMKLTAALPAARTSRLDVLPDSTGSHQRAGSISTSTATTATSGTDPKVWKRYESELRSLLEEQRQRREAHLTINGEATQMTQLQSSSSSMVEGSAVFSLARPLLGAQSTGTLVDEIPPPSLATLLSHPVCLELVKGQLQQIHSVENLAFFVHVQRYKKLRRPGTLKSLARCIFDEFIRPGAPQEININTRQRESITHAVTKKGNDSCSVDLFREAEREVLQLMETNVMKVIQNSPVLRLCSWLLASLPNGALSGVGSAKDTMGDVLQQSRISVEEGDLDEPVS